MSGGDFPRNVYYGDGSPIGIRSSRSQERYWKLRLVSMASGTFDADNMLTAMRATLISFRERSLWPWVK